MSNTLAPNGFQAIRRKDSAAPNYAETIYQLAYNNANTIACGDPVRLLATGYIDACSPAQAIAGAVMLGIFNGVEYFDSVQQKKLFLPSWGAPSTAVAGSVKAHIIDDEGAVFRAQVTNGQALQANIGQNCNFIGQGAPNAAGQGVAGVDQTTFANTSTLPFRIVGLGEQVGDDNTSAYNYVEVVFNSTLQNVLTGV